MSRDLWGWYGSDGMNLSKGVWGSGGGECGDKGARNGKVSHSRGPCVRCAREKGVKIPGRVETKEKVG